MRNNILCDRFHTRELSLAWQHYYRQVLLIKLSASLADILRLLPLNNSLHFYNLGTFIQFPSACDRRRSHSLREPIFVRINQPSLTDTLDISFAIYKLHQIPLPVEFFGLWLKRNRERFPSPILPPSTLPISEVRFRYTREHFSLKQKGKGSSCSPVSQLDWAKLAVSYNINSGCTGMMGSGPWFVVCGEMWNYWLWLYHSPPNGNDITTTL
jgi:hypothetical protein